MEDTTSTGLVEGTAHLNELHNEDKKEISFYKPTRKEKLQQKITKIAGRILVNHGYKTANNDILVKLGTRTITKNKFIKEVGELSKLNTKNLTGAISSLVKLERSLTKVA